jgi:hypothetical protein
MYKMSERGERSEPLYGLLYGARFARPFYTFYIGIKNKMYKIEPIQKYKFEKNNIDRYISDNLITIITLS